MRSSPPRTMSMHERAIRLVAAACAAATVGGAAAAVRPMFRGSVHYEAVVALFVLLPAMLLWLLWSLRRVPRVQAIVWFALEVAIVCTAFTIAWMAVYGRQFAELLQVMAVYGVVAWLAGAAIILLLQWLRPLRSGPYCPACGYCLIGTTEDRCPECGRPFELAELGVTREALNPAVPVATDSSLAAPRESAHDPT